MPLPVLPPSQTVINSDLVRLFHQSQLTWFGHLSEETEVDFGRWLPAVGCLLDAFLLPDINPEQLLNKTEALARTNQTAWRTCSLNPSVPIDRIKPLVDALINSNWKHDPLDIFLRQTKLPSQPLQISNLTIIPARASFRHFTELMEERGNADHALSHLDDPHLDAILALKDGRAVGCIQVLTSGHVGTLREWYVSPAHRSLGIGRLLLHRAMEICHRGALKHVMIGMEPTAEVARRLCETSGFVHIGQWLNFSRIPNELACEKLGLVLAPSITDISTYRKEPCTK